jgi:hypothetical protein
MNTLNRNESLSYPIASGIDLQPIMRQVYIWMGLETLLTQDRWLTREVRLLTKVGPLPAA